MLELSLYSDEKPFECVGTYEEVRYAITLTINNIDGELPYLLKYYKEHFPLSTDIKYEKLFNDENNIDDEFINIVKGELSKYV